VLLDPSMSRNRAFGYTFYVSIANPKVVSPHLRLGRSVLDDGVAKERVQGDIATSSRASLPGKGTLARSRQRMEFRRIRAESAGWSVGEGRADARPRPTLVPDNSDPIIADCVSPEMGLSVVRPVLS